MPTTASPRTASWTILGVAPPGAAAENIGVLLIDLNTGTPYRRFRRDLEDLSPDDADILEALEEDLALKAAEMGGEQLLRWLDENASGFLRISDLETGEVHEFKDQVNWLYHQHIKPKVLRFRTHLPLYALEAAAGRWGPERDVEQEPKDWVEAPSSLRRLTEDMFIARVTGHSMEPLIPAGSLCIFKGGASLGGSRQGKRVLVANYGEPGEQRFTVKRYQSIKRAVDDDRTEHLRVILHPLNPEYESWEIDYEPFDFESSGRIKVVGEFVAVLDDQDPEV
ncbi:MAG: LexA family transcriptional regulator [Bryobacteraceae bacterium]|nr:LexA family transcriptional regulator [Bryobacteraceae bacterium]